MCIRCQRVCAFINKVDSLTDVTLGLLYQILCHDFVSSLTCQVKRRPVALIPHICTTQIVFLVTNVYRVLLITQLLVL